MGVVHKFREKCLASETRRNQPPKEVEEMVVEPDFSAEDGDTKIESSDSDDKDEEEYIPVCKEVKKARKKLSLVCEYCSRTFTRREHLTNHIRSIHTSERPFKCDLCEATYTTSQHLLVHKRRHADDRRYICTYCGKRFMCSSDVKRHTKSHLNKREYTCDMCGKGFNTNSTLRTHKIWAHGDPQTWKFVCSFCEKRFPGKAPLEAHARRHTGDRKFTCDLCNKQFYDKRELQQHHRSHSNVRAFKCELCPSEYKDPQTLNVHKKRVHDVGNATVPKPSKRFACHICAKMFTADNKLQKHLRSHTGEKPFECKLCEKRFADGWYLKVHLKTKHHTIEEDGEAINYSVH